ncbi:MAG: family transposase [Gemmatimonadetes bacterium]|nr:family transposase [Gemmatimonadota bacterium]
MVRTTARTHPDAEIQVWVQDEARFGQHGTLTRVWARRGSRPTAIKQNEYESLYVLGAACPATGQSVGFISPTLNTAVVNHFLEEMSQELAPGVFALLVWDQAGYHTSKDLRIPANIGVLHLPPYSPELNPIENLWHYLRSHHGSNRLYTDYTALLDAATDAWKKVCLDPARIRSVCAKPYLMLGTN